MDKNKEMETKKKEEQMTEKEESAIFCKAFYDEAREIEARAQKVDMEVDEARMEAMYQRMMAKMAADETAAGTDTPDETAKKGSGKVVALSRKSPKHLLRWVAVLALVCAGVFGVSMQSQAGKDGLWSSIQRLIGVESRWEQKNNDEDREYTNTEEWNAVADIEEELAGVVPKFYYWPGKILFQEYEIQKDADSFAMIYQEGEKIIYFEGWFDTEDSSGLSIWEGQGETSYEIYDDIKYKIVKMEGSTAEQEPYYYVEWNVDNAQFILSGLTDFTEIEKILKNIKN